MRSFVALSVALFALLFTNLACQNEPQLSGTYEADFSQLMPPDQVEMLRNALDSLPDEMREQVELGLAVFEHGIFMEFSGNTFVSSGPPELPESRSEGTYTLSNGLLSMTMTTGEQAGETFTASYDAEADTITLNLGDISPEAAEFGSLVFRKVTDN